MGKKNRTLVAQDPAAFHPDKSEWKKSRKISENTLLNKL
jgi:hypothetical protein